MSPVLTQSDVGQRIPARHGQAWPEEHRDTHSPLCMRGFKSWNEASHSLCAPLVGFRTDTRSIRGIVGSR